MDVWVVLCGGKQPLAVLNHEGRRASCTLILRYRGGNVKRMLAVTQRKCDRDGGKCYRSSRQWAVSSEL